MRYDPEILEDICSRGRFGSLISAKGVMTGGGRCRRSLECGDAVATWQEGQVGADAADRGVLGLGVCRGMGMGCAQTAHSKLVLGLLLL